MGEVMRVARYVVRQDRKGEDPLYYMAPGNGATLNIDEAYLYTYREIREIMEMDEREQWGRKQGDCVIMQRWVDMVLDDGELVPVPRAVLNGGW